MWGAGDQVEVHPLWRYFYQGPSGLICVVNSNVLNKVVDAEEERNKLVKKSQHTDTFDRNSLGQKLSDVRMGEDLW